MLYCINGKIYILANGYYKEVSIDMVGKEYDVKIKENGNTIEYVHNEQEPQISLKEAYDKTHKRYSKEEV